MARREAFLIRVDPELLAALRKWAGDELRSVNGQVEFLLRRAVMDAGRLPARGGADSSDRASKSAPQTDEPSP